MSRPVAYAHREQSAPFRAAWDEALEAELAQVQAAEALAPTGATRNRLQALAERLGLGGEA